MQHKGEILEKAIRESGHSITKLAQKMGKSRRWVYQIFDSANVPIDYIIDIGKIIHHDFTDEIKGIKIYSDTDRSLTSREMTYSRGVNSTEVDFWKEKYMDLLERYNELLLKK
jgi:predicted transcriptional regulator